MGDNIHESILQWLMTYKPLAEWYFNINRAEAETINVIPISGEVFTEQWIDGGGIVYYDFAINIFKAISDTPAAAQHPTQNADELFDVQAFMAWITEQEKLGNYPDIGYAVQEIVVLQNFPTSAGEDDHLMKIQFPGRIIYIKE